MPVVFLSLFFFTSVANALLVTPDALEERLKSADLEAIIEVESLTSEPDAQMFAVYSAKAKILEVLRSSVRLRLTYNRLAYNDNDGVIVVHGPGGEIGDTGVLVSGYPRPHRGMRYLAHLNQNADGTFSVAGFDKGLEPLDLTRNFSRNRTDGSNGDGDGAFLYWENTFLPIPYSISWETLKTFPEFPAAIDASFRTWRDVQGAKVEFQPAGCTPVAKNDNDGINNIIFVDSQWNFDPAAIAITRNFYIAGNTPRSGLILDSDILLNGVYHAFTTTGEL